MPSCKEALIPAAHSDLLTMIEFLWQWPLMIKTLQPAMHAHLRCNSAAVREKGSWFIGEPIRTVTLVPAHGRLHEDFNLIARRMVSDLQHPEHAG